MNGVTAELIIIEFKEWAHYLTILTPCYENNSLLIVPSPGQRLGADTGLSLRTPPL